MDCKTNPLFVIERPDFGSAESISIRGNGIDFTLVDSVIIKSINGSGQMKNAKDMGLVEISYNSGHSEYGDITNKLILKFTPTKNAWSDLSLAYGKKISSQTTISFINPISNDIINKLINQIDLENGGILISKTRKEIDADSQSFLCNVYGFLKSFPQFQVRKLMKTRFDEMTSEIKDNEASIKSKTNEMSKITGTLIADVNKKAALQKEIDELNETNKTTSDSRKTISLVLANADALYSKIFGRGEDFQASLNDRSGVFGKFGNRVMLIFQTIDDALISSGKKDLKALSRSKSNSAIKTSSVAETSAGVDLNPDDKVLRAKEATILAQNNIINITGITATNYFSDHAPMGQALSVLDIMRDEKDIVAFSSSLSVEKKITEITTATNNESDCAKILKQFSPADLGIMIKSLQDKIAINTKKLGKNIIDLRRIQGSGYFQWGAAFGGNGGIDFKNLDTSQLGTFNWNALKANVKANYSAVKDMVVDDIGGDFGNAVNNATGVIKADAMALYQSAADAMNAINFKRVINSASPDLVASCTALQQIKKTMQNPDDIASVNLTSVKENTKQTANLYNSKVDEVKAGLANSADLASQVTNIQQILKTLGR